MSKRRNRAEVAIGDVRVRATHALDEVMGDVEKAVGAAGRRTRKVQRQIERSTQKAERQLSRVWNRGRLRVRRIRGKATRRIEQARARGNSPSAD